MRRLEARRTCAALAAVLCAVLLAACSTNSSRTAPSIADDVRAIQAMSGAALAAEDDRLANSDSPRARLLRALILGAPAHPQRNVETARLSLQRLQGGTSEGSRSIEIPPETRELAAALDLWLAEQQRAEGALQRRAADEKRIEQLDARAREFERRVQEVERRALEAERRTQEAERKLEALRAIEKEMSGRAPVKR